MKTVAATLVGLLGLAVFGALLLDDPDQSGSRTTTGDGELPAPTTATATATASGPASSTSAASSPTTVTSPTPTASATGSASASPSVAPATEPRIETSDSFYFGEPFETILIPGTYVGITGPARLRVQLRQPEGWAWFPLPVFTRPSGEFRAFVEMAAGSYRVRLFDPVSGVKSRVLTVLVV